MTHIDTYPKMFSEDNILRLIKKGMDKTAMNMVIYNKTVLTSYPVEENDIVNKEAETIYIKGKSKNK